MFFLFSHSRIQECFLVSSEGAAKGVAARERRTKLRRSCGEGAARDVLRITVQDQRCVGIERTLIRTRQKREKNDSGRRLECQNHVTLVDIGWQAGVFPGKQQPTLGQHSNGQFLLVGLIFFSHCPLVGLKFPLYCGRLFQSNVAEHLLWFPPDLLSRGRRIVQKHEYRILRISSNTDTE